MIKLILLSLLICSQLFARELNFEEKMSDLNELITHVKSGYGPLEYKKKKINLDIDELTKKYTVLIKDSKNNAEFYYLIIKFVGEFNDSHFRASLPTTLETTLGFSVDLVQDKVLIDEIDHRTLSERKFPFYRGDELISLNGKPVDKIIKEILPYMGHGSKLTAKRRAVWQLTKRRASQVPAQKGSVLVEIRQDQKDSPQKVALEWIAKGKYSDEFKSFNNYSRRGIDYDMLMIEENSRCSGKSRINIPQNAKMIINEPFTAYYYPHAKGNIGYLRLPHYSPTESNPSIDARKLRFQQYEYAIKILEKNTIGLIIDQDHNCGGSVEWMHQILSLFMDRPFVPLQFELLASKASVKDFEGWLFSSDSNTIEYQNSLMVGELIKKTWLETTDRLTKKTAINGAELIYPHPIRYSKPVIVLIDELSGSGGDAFPALMQGYGRAKLLGTRTMGAGGHVEDLPPLSYSQISISITKSLFYRPDGVAIENNGSEPDILYSPTVEDFKNKYKDYQKFYTSELLKLI